MCRHRCTTFSNRRKQLGKVLKRLDQETMQNNRSQNSFRFVDVTVKSISTIEIEFEAPSPWRYVSVLMEIVPVNVLVRLGLDVLDTEQLYADNVIGMFCQNLLRGLSRKTVGMYLLFSTNAHIKFSLSTFYPSKQLHKLNQQFPHPSARKIYMLLKKAGLQAVNPQTLEQI